MKSYETFNEWYQAQPTHHRRLISKLRKIIFHVAPRLEESSKWGNGCWMKGDLPLLYIHSETDHIQFGFFAGALLSDPKKILRGSGKYVRHLRIENLNDINENAFSTMIRKAVKAPNYK